MIAARIRALDEALAAAAPDQHQACILPALEDEAPRVREHAIALAARHLSPERLGELLANDDNAQLRNSALVALERQGPYAVPHLLTLARGDRPEVAMFAVQVLARIRDASCIAALLPLMEHPDSNIAQAAVEALGNLGARQAVPGLVRLLRGEVWLQFAAVEALGVLGDERAVEPLLALAPDELLGELAVEALGKIAAPRALTALLGQLIAIERLPLRDHLLRAVAATLERHPEGDVAPLVEPGGLARYLEPLLAGDDVGLARAAATLAVAGGLAELLPAALLRAGDVNHPEEARWTAALMERYQRRSRADLLGLLGHGDARVRRAALATGSFDASAAAALAARLGDDSAEVRVAACVALGKARDPAAVPMLVERLRAGADEERAAAAEALGHLPGASLGALGAVLAGPDELVLAALTALEAARSQLFAAELAALVGSPSVRIRAAAVRVLAGHGASAEALLTARLSDRDDAVRLEAIGALVDRHASSAVPLLLERLASADALRYHVIRALGRLGDAQALEPLAALFPEARPHERIEIVTAVGRLGTVQAAGFLEARLEDGDREMRRTAADALARLGAPALLELLMQLAGDDDWTIRNHAGWGLGLLALEPAREVLLTLCRDVEPVVARTARAALAKLPGSA